VGDSRHRIRNALLGRRNGVDFLDASAKSFNVVIPVKDGTNVKIVEGVAFDPLFEIVTLDTGL